MVIDLTSEGPDGLDGRVKVLLLQDYLGKLSEMVELEEDSFYCEALGEELHNSLEQKFGYIVHIGVDYAEREGKTEGFSTEFHSLGRWSQQGFHVKHPLFVEHETFSALGKLPSSIDYPFVIHYDLNLSGDFTTNLTADRLRIIPDAKFEDVKRRICEVISTLLLENLGKKEVERSQDFFRNVIKEPGDDTVKRVFEVCLQRMLSE